MSIIKGTNQIVAGFGGTKRSIGEVYFSQSSLATDNSGALPGWTGEYYENGKTLFPDLYNFVKAHSELQVTKEQYDSAIATYGECPKYVVDENGGTTTGTITVYGWLASGSTFYTKTRNPVAGDSVWSSTDTTQESIYTVISLSNDTLTFSGPTKEWSGTYSTTTTGTGIVTTSGTSLRLPKYANYIKMANSTEGITQKGAGLPNITGYLASIDTGGRWGLIANASADNYNINSGAFRAQNNGNYTQSVSTGKGVASGDLYFDASKSNAIYGSSATVQPAHTTLYPWVVAYTAAIPASTAQAAEFQQALSGKADTNLGNTTPSQSFKEMSVGWGMPDYSAGVSVANSTILSGFTAPSDGVLIFDGGMANATINGIGIAAGYYYTPNSAAYGQPVSMLLSKGEILKATNVYTTTDHSVFYPFKGVN